MNELRLLLSSAWGRLYPKHKKMLLPLLTLCLILVGNACWKKSPRYVALFPNKNMSATEKQLICQQLENASIVYKTHSKKGILVPKSQATLAKQELQDFPIHKQESTKGFELFDTNTWIKGEKELQVLEMRALKGQLEKDLAAFDKIKSANVILDIPPQKSFHQSPKYQTKASVILTLMPHVRISQTDLLAIANHLSGAVRGLEPSMIAISDTTGKLYQAIYSDNLDLQQTTAQASEDQIEEKLRHHLAPMFGDNHFHISVQALLHQESGKLESLNVAILIDSTPITQKADFREGITRHITAITQGYGVPCNTTIDFIPFNHPASPPQVKKWSFFPFLFFVLFLSGAITAIGLPFFRKKKAAKEMPIKPVTHINLKQLSQSIQGEHPRTIASMLTYLEPAKAEQILSELHLELQQEVLYQLSELEKGSI